MDRMEIEPQIAYLVNKLQNDHNIRIFFFKTDSGALAVNTGTTVKDAAYNAGLDWDGQVFSYWSLSDIIQEGLQDDGGDTDDSSDGAMPFADLDRSGDGQPDAPSSPGVADPTADAFNRIARIAAETGAVITFGGRD